MMTVHIGGVDRQITRRTVHIGDTDRNITRREIWDGDAFRVIENFVPSLSASVSPPFASGTAFNSGIAVTSTVMVTPEGGKAPFTYAWSPISGVGVITSPSFATTQFQRFVGSGQTVMETFQCVVTDSLGSTVSVNVDVTFSSFEFDIGDFN